MCTVLGLTAPLVRAGSSAAVRAGLDCTPAALRASIGWTSALVRAGLVWVAAVCAALLWTSAPVAADPEDVGSAALPSAMLERLAATALPARDPVDLARRLRGAPATSEPAAPRVSTPLEAGREDGFWILDQRSPRLFQVQATLRLMTEHAYWYVQSDLADRAPQPDLEQSAAVFESHTYPTIRTYFGAERSPGVDGDPHIVFLLGNVPGVAAYFSSADAYPRSVNPRSNEHEMIYVNLNALRPGQTSFDSTMAHEFQHMVHFASCPAQESWVDEGAAELASRVDGFDGPPPQAFIAHPDVQLTTWSTESNELARHYQAAYLFVRYTAERAGGWESLPNLLSTCARGETLFDGFVRRQGLSPDVDSFFADWAVANLIDDPSVSDGRFAYAGGAIHVASTGVAGRDAPFLGSVPQYAANYVELPTGEGTAEFSGDTLVPLVVPADAAPGPDSPVWWSNRGDGIDARLTRRLDLRGVSQATARFRTWYDLEDKFDYVYLTASHDGGKTWQVLPGRQATPDAATGNNYGMGWSGASGGWVDEEVDLTPVAGSEILLRFEYITDQSYTGQGFAFRDFQVPQFGLSEPGADEGAWSAEGWVRVDAPVPERWTLRLVRWLPSGVQVDAVAVGPDGHASFGLDPTATRSVLVVVPTAPRTVQPASYQVTLTDEPGLLQ
jgi:immune inhibitor A